MLERNFDNEIIEKFEVGCLTESIDIKKFLLDKNYNIDDLISLGLVFQKLIMIFTGLELYFRLKLFLEEQLVLVLGL